MDKINAPNIAHLHISSVSPSHKHTNATLFPYKIAIRISQQSLNELLNKLEKNGYVERKPSESDKRVMIVHLTEKRKQVQQPETDYQNIFSCLLPTELEQLSQYLDRIIEAFQEQYKNVSDENDMTSWMNRARERMGNEHFDQLMSMRERAFGHRNPPKDIPGAERFSSDYDGPAPDRTGFPPKNFNFDIYSNIKSPDY